MDDALTRLEIPGTYNFRAVAPGTLTPGRLYRSDALHRLTGTGRQRMLELGITEVIDLRSRLDRRIGGRDRLRGTGAVRISLPIDGVPPRVDLTTISLAEVYRVIVSRHQQLLGAAIGTIAASDGPVLVHCTAGKDRTGLVVALTLAAIGVDRDVILDDYERTAANLAGPWTERMVRKARRFRIPLTDDLIAIMASSPRDVLSETLDWVDAEFGGIIEYLTAAGVDADVRAALHAKLLP